MENSKKEVKVLFVCGYGVGSSAMSAGIVQKELDKRHVNSVVKHTAAGEAQGFNDWVDVIAVSKKLIDIVNVDQFPGKDVIEVENIMDGATIADQILSIVKEKFPEAIEKG
ncbi:PTS sugar transporter subunit IIB [Streptococcus pacificus]|uniref:PTS EIIB type-2 domain-containing protein n=1 Tax=Streptococcus pacificus TaxID=2740577 RepID=A0ABS0ZJ77_9STRE|nr:hypothetical protein [Streptococcus pacificus]MBJ8325773.1 hypothetical protein [Streptococcus pacificus]